ncbi:MAG: VWA domain-containing protein [Planctomycetota bacterium]
MIRLTTQSLLCAGVITTTLCLTPTADACPKCATPPPKPIIVVCPAPEPVVHPAPIDPIPEPNPAPQPEAAKAPLIQIAILLDTSNSMDGLIDQAKAQLWMIVNRFAKAQRDGVDPNFQIALFQYGNTSLPAEEGYIQQVVSFTNDLDKVSAALFALTTNGGDEYCGQVMDEALTRLPWSPNGNDFKAIYIAGNEPFTQGNVHYVGVCKRAKDKGVLVNTIHCGKHEAGVSGKWQHGAHLAGGSFMTINQDRSLVTPAAPQDEALAKLNTELNKTYLHYGKKGAVLKEQQAELDVDNAKLSADAGAQRIQSKAGRLYSNAHWDLIDACDQKDFDLAKIPENELPEEIRGKTLEQKQAYIDKLSEKRKAIQEKIRTLGAERGMFIAKERAAAAEAEGETLGEAINESIDAQLEDQGFDIEEVPAPEPVTEAE